MSPAVFLSLAIMFNVAANYLLKAKADKIDTTSIISQLLSVPFITVIVLFGMNLLLYSRAVKSMELSVAYPILVGSSVVAIHLLSLYVLGEKESWVRAVGAGLIVVGVLIVSREVEA